MWPGDCRGGTGAEVERVEERWRSGGGAVEDSGGAVEERWRSGGGQWRSGGSWGGVGPPGSGRAWSGMPACPHCKMWRAREAGECRTAAGCAAECARRLGERTEAALEYV